MARRPRLLIKLLHELGLYTGSLLIPPLPIRLPLRLQRPDLLVEQVMLHQFIRGLENRVAPIG